MRPPAASRVPASVRERNSLSDEQRGRIYEGVMGVADAPVAAAPAPALADALPSGVAMQDLPASLTREIPLVRGHKFVKFDDRIVVVDPASRLVVAMIPRYKLLPQASLQRVPDAVQREAHARKSAQDSHESAKR
jgi:hypothetical protein